MHQAPGRLSAKGFTLLETMIALLVLGVGILGLAAMLGDALQYMRGSQDDFIAQQKAEEAAEAIFTAKYTNGITWAQVANNNAANPAGLFLNGPQPILQPGATDGLVGTVADAGQPEEYVLTPGPDGISWGTADDVKMYLYGFTRTIAIANVAGDTNLRTIQIVVTYNTGRFSRATIEFLYFGIQLEPRGARYEAGKRILTDRVDGGNGNYGCSSGSCHAGNHPGAACKRGRGAGSQPPAEPPARECISSSATSRKQEREFLPRESRSRTLLREFPPSIARARPRPPYSRMPLFRRPLIRLYLQ